MIKVRYYNIEGKVQKTTLTGFLSKLFQHELDHLNGITFNTHVSKLKWDMAKKKLEKIVNARI